MDQTISEYNQRQYQLMGDLLDGFEKRTVNLRRLISGLEGLLEVLQTPEETWKEAFRSEWWPLEEVYAVALDQGKTVLSPEDQKVVEEAMQNLKGLITQKL